MAPVPRGWKKRPDPPRPAAVMILIYADALGALHLVLTLRQRSLRGHSGQVSFPGGRRDRQDPSLHETALRETREEIGICESAITILGQLPPLYIPASHFEVLPVIGLFEGQPVFAPNPAEVAEVFSFALDDLPRERFKCVENRRVRGVDVRAPYYAVAGHKVWGATAMLLSELECRLRIVMRADALPDLE